MSTGILIIGDSGTGKSTSLRNLPPEETFIINVLGKPLPIRGFLNNFKPLSPDGLEGNYYITDSGQTIARIMDVIDKKRPEIKYLIIDDLGFSIMNNYMRKVMIKSYDKFNEISNDFHLVADKFNSLRPDLYVIATMHIDTDEQGKTKPKTVGKSINNHTNIEGRFLYVLHTAVIDGQYKLLTNNDGVHMAKSSMGLFPPFIDNDMKHVCDEIHKFNNEDINQ